MLEGRKRAVLHLGNIGRCGLFDTAGEAIKLLEESWFEAVKGSKHLVSSGAWYTLTMGDGSTVKFQPSKWKDKIKDEKFRARILKIMDEEVILKFDQREGDAADYYDIEGDTKNDTKE